LRFLEKFTMFENKENDIKIEYPQSWNIREDDIEHVDIKIEIAIFTMFSTTQITS